ncbi:MAG: hypothetical protein ABI232_06880, partial [Jatrophihabitantaceae bacterium]
MSTSSNQAEECNLDVALGVAESGDTIVLEADPGGGATFTTTTGWTVGSGLNGSNLNLSIEPAPGVPAVLDGQHTAEFLLVHPFAGSLTVTGVTFENSVSNHAGGGGIFNNVGSLTVANSTFTDNTTTGGSSLGGGIVNGHGSVSVSNSTFTDNTTSGETTVGGGIVTSGGSVSVADSTFTGN